MCLLSVKCWFKSPAGASQMRNNKNMELQQMSLVASDNYYYHMWKVQRPTFGMNLLNWIICHPVWLRKGNAIGMIDSLLHKIPLGWGACEVGSWLPYSTDSILHLFSFMTNPKADNVSWTGCCWVKCQVRCKFSQVEINFEQGWPTFGHNNACLLEWLQEMQS